MPIVSCLAFSMDGEGCFARECVDVFGNVAWDQTRLKVQAKADEWRRQGFIGPTMASQAELSSTGILQTLASLERDFELRHDTGADASALEPVGERLREARGGVVARAPGTGPGADLRLTRKSPTGWVLHTSAR